MKMRSYRFADRDAILFQYPVHMVKTPQLQLLNFRCVVGQPLESRDGTGHDQVVHSL